MSNHPQPFGQSVMRMLLYALLMFSVLYTIAQPSVFLYDTIITHQQNFNLNNLISRLLPTCLSVGLIYLSLYLLNYQNHTD